jgi:hypothetical protein
VVLYGKKFEEYAAMITNEIKVAVGKALHK